MSGVKGWEWHIARLHAFGCDLRYGLPCEDECQRMRDVVSTAMRTRDLEIAANYLAGQRTAFERAAKIAEWSNGEDYEAIANAIRQLVPEPPQ